MRSITAKRSRPGGSRLAAGWRSSRTTAWLCSSSPWPAMFSATSTRIPAAPGTRSSSAGRARARSQQATRCGLRVPYGLAMVARATTVVVPPCDDPRGVPDRRARRDPPRACPRRADHLAVYRRRGTGRGGPARRAPRHHPLGGMRGDGPALPAGDHRPGRALRGRRGHPHLGRKRREHRPLPARRPARIWAPT